MTDDVVARAKEALEGVTEEPWVAVNNGDVCSVLGIGVVVAAAMTAEDSIFCAYARSLIPELVAEVERLRAHIAAMPSAIQAYADGELTAISYVSAHPSLTNAELVAFTAEKDTLLRFQRDAESIVAYAATAVQR